MAEEMMKKPKIIVVGIGNSGSKLVENLSKNNSSNVKCLSFAENIINDKLHYKHNIETIDLSEATKITLEEAKSYCVKYDKLKELEEMLSIIQNEDELFKIYPKNSGCLQPEKNWMKIKLKRNGKTINCFELFFKKVKHIGNK